MPIRVECPDCRAALSVRDSLAGRRVKCPRCNAPITVPSAEVRAGAGASASAEAAVESETYLLAGPAPGAKARAVPVRPTEASGVAGAHVAQAVAPTRRSQSAREILAAFRGEIEPVPT